jgi:hypothetical protein
MGDRLKDGSGLLDTIPSIAASSAQMAIRTLYDPRREIKPVRHAAQERQAGSCGLGRRARKPWWRQARSTELRVIVADPLNQSLNDLPSVNRIERLTVRLRQGLAHLGINARGKFVQFGRDFASLLPVDDMSHGFDNLLSSFSGVLPEIVGPSLLNPDAGREETAKEARLRMHIQAGHRAKTGCNDGSDPGGRSGGREPREPDCPVVAG